MMKYSLTDLAKILGSNLANLRYNNKLIEEQRKIVNPTFLEILEQLNEDDELLAASLMNWYMKKYEKYLDKNSDLSKLIFEQFEKKQQRSSSYSSCGCDSCGWDDSNNDRC